MWKSEQQLTERLRQELSDVQAELVKVDNEVAFLDSLIF